LDARLTALLCKKKITVAKSKEVKSRWSNSRLYRQMWQNFEGRLWLKSGRFASDEDDGEIVKLSCS
jgi:transposase